MANSQYNADSAPLPQPPLPCSGNNVGTFKSLNLPAPFSKGTLPVPTTFVLRGTNAYVGESAHFGRRYLERVSIHRKAGQSGTPTPISID
jgi:hypothetical protein